MWDVDVGRIGMCKSKLDVVMEVRQLVGRSSYYSSVRCTEVRRGNAGMMQCMQICSRLQDKLQLLSLAAVEDIGWHLPPDDYGIAT